MANEPTPEQRASDKAFIAALIAEDENIDRVRRPDGVLEVAIFWLMQWSPVERPYDDAELAAGDPDTHHAIALLREAYRAVVRDMP